MRLGFYYHVPAIHKDGRILHAGLPWGALLTAWLRTLPVSDLFPARPAPE